MQEIVANDVRAVDPIYFKAYISSILLAEYLFIIAWPRYKL